jgi:UDP-N-acetylmuramate dehydrogenase
MITPSPAFIQHKSLKEVCTLGIGGEAGMFIAVHSIDLMREVFDFCRQERLRYFILGKGSNTLFDDKGFQGVVIQNKIDFMEERVNGHFYVGAGYSFSLLGSQTARKGWSGLEFASGIPGSVGGAVFMNAGANGRETCEHLVRVDFLSENGELHHFSKNELTFSYRHSSFHELKGAIVGASFELTPSNDARKTQIEIINHRTKTQPYGEKSAGCMFRNLPSLPAGALIDQCGLKGLNIGGAKVSELHANFIINSGNGTAEEVKRLIKLIREKVKEHSGLDLESEVIFVPYSEGE